MVGCRRQFGLAYINVINVAWNYKRTPRIEVAYTNYFTGSSDIYTGKTPVLDSGALSAHPSIGEKLYYNGGLFLNESIDLTSIGL